jgi:hypothetical protein
MFGSYNDLLDTTVDPDCSPVFWRGSNVLLDTTLPLAPPTKNIISRYDLCRDWGGLMLSLATYYGLLLGKSLLFGV